MISVVIPAYNAAATIGDCLTALAVQTVPADRYEVIVVDDSSTDQTAQIAAELGARVVAVPHGGPAAARNQGVAVARGEVILFTDADCVPAPDWMERMVAPIANGADGVKGAYLTRQRGLLPRFIQVEFEEKYRQLARADQIDFVDTYAAAYRRDVLERFGGFDAAFPAHSAEDVELSFRLARQGCRLVFEPQARVYHLHADRLSGYLYRKLRYGIFRTLVYRRFPGKVVGDAYTPKSMIIQIGLAGLLLAALAAALVTPFALGPAGLIALLYLLTTLPFAVRAARRDLLVGVVAPVLLFLRSAAQGWGLVIGLALTGLGALAGRPADAPVRGREPAKR